MEEGQRIMQHILEEFVSAAHALRSIPVVLLIPAVRHWEEGRRVPAYNDFRMEIMKPSFPDLVIVDLYDAEFDESRFNVLPYTGHASSYGNQVIAQHMAANLKEARLLEARVHRPPHATALRDRRLDQ